MTPDNEIIKLIYDMQVRQGEKLDAISLTVTETKTQMTDLIGNGQPGRIARLEKAVEILKRFRWMVLGYASAISFVISTGFAIAHALKH